MTRRQSTVDKVNFDRIREILDQSEHPDAASKMSTSETKSLLESLLNVCIYFLASSCVIHSFLASLRRYPTKLRGSWYKQEGQEADAQADIDRCDAQIFIYYKCQDEFWSH